MNYSSSCNCGQVGVSITLSNPIEDYDSRACDCEFCKLHEINYISDPDGEISIESVDNLNQLKQGSEQASFWQCSCCNQIVAVTYQFDDEVRGAANAKLFSKVNNLKNPVTVSPRLLSSAEKRKRWSASWFKVNFNVNGNT